MTTLAVAELVATEVASGWQVTRDDVPLGKRYVVRWDVRRLEWVVDVLTGRRMRVDMVWVCGPGRPGWMPVQLLRLVEGSDGSGSGTEAPGAAGGGGAGAGH